MYSLTQLAARYIRYFFTASNGRGHGVHSPFVFAFIKDVLNDTRHFYAYGQVEAVRNNMLKDERLLTIEDFGAGSAMVKNNQRKVNSIARSSLKAAKYGQLLFRMVDHFKLQHIVELGTSLGVTTAYLASANPAASVTTMEGAPEVAAVASENFKTLGLQNVHLVKGNFDDTLPGVLANMPRIDLAFVDGNHRKAPTLSYFEQMLPKTHHDTILIFDDIHWSRDMEEAWAAIQSHPSVTLTIDLFFIGLVFFRPQQKQTQHFTVRF